jgi:hypothetical protein
MLRLAFNRDAAHHRSKEVCPIHSNGELAPDAEFDLSQVFEVMVVVPLITCFHKMDPC